MLTKLILLIQTLKIVKQNVYYWMKYYNSNFITYKLKFQNVICTIYLIKHMEGQLHL